MGVTVGAGVMVVVGVGVCVGVEVRVGVGMVVGVGVGVGVLVGAVTVRQVGSERFVTVGQTVPSSKVEVAEKVILLLVALIPVTVTGKLMRVDEEVGDILTEEGSEDR